MINSIKEVAKKIWFLRRLHKQYTFKTCLIDWKSLLRKEKELWESRLCESKKGPKILIATAVGAQLHSINIESLLAAALTLRGVEVHTLLCDSVLPACFACMINQYQSLQNPAMSGLARQHCKNCFPPAYRFYHSLGIPTFRFSEFLNAEEIRFADSESSAVSYDAIEHYLRDGISVGEHALAGALRFYARGTLDEEPYAEQILRQYFKASLLTMFAMKRLLKRFDYECTVFSHGIYVPQGLMGEVCRSLGVRVVNWVPSYRKKTFIFSHDDTYHHTLMTEPIEKWINIQWNEQLESELMEYLKSRWTGKQDWIWFSDDTPEFEISRISREIGIDFSKPCIGMLTNVFWDAQLHYPDNVFPNMLDWIFKTISYFAERQDLQLLIRVHPAEIKSSLPSRQKAVDEIKKAFPVLPKNVFVIPPESKISTYAAMSKCNATIIYGTKTGVELANMGIPVIVAGEAWIRNKGITIDATSETAYFKLLDNLPLKNRLDKKTLEKARKYAYHFFFRRMIPLDFVEPFAKTLFKARLCSLQELMPGRSNGFDIICNGILTGSDFIYPAEQIKKEQS